jgi:hypothetical protein
MHGPLHNGCDFKYDVHISQPMDSFSQRRGVDPSGWLVLVQIGCKMMLGCTGQAM